MTSKRYRDRFFAVLPLLVAASLLPLPAYAQSISSWIAGASVSPLLVLLLALLLGVIYRSWLVAAGHAGIVILWVVLFVLASRYVEDDFVIWLPLAAFVVHAILIVVLTITGLAGRSRRK